MLMGCCCVPSGNSKQKKIICVFNNTPLHMISFKDIMVEEGGGAQKEHKKVLCKW